VWFALTTQHTIHDTLYAIRGYQYTVPKNHQEWDNVGLPIIVIIPIALEPPNVDAFLWRISFSFSPQKQEARDWSAKRGSRAGKRRERKKRDFPSPAKVL
jgi:hypothetical protein